MKKSYLEVLKKYRKYLECSRTKFEVFETMNFDRLEHDNGNTWMVASILDRVVNYALIVEAFDSYEFDKLERNIRLSGNEEIYQEAGTIFSACHELVMDAIDNDCKNPAFGVFKDCVDGYKLYEAIADGLTSTIGEIEDEDVQLEIVELMDLLDSPINDTDDQIFMTLSDKIPKNFTTSELLEYLSKLAKESFRTHLLMGNANIVSHGNIIFKKPNHSIIDMNNGTMAEIFNIINHTSLELSLENMELIEGLNYMYNQYKGYQYDYLKNKGLSESMIEKCKVI